MTPPNLHTRPFFPDGAGLIGDQRPRTDTRRVPGRSCLVMVVWPGWCQCRDVTSNRAEPYLDSILVFLLTIRNTMNSVRKGNSG